MKWIFVLIVFFCGCITQPNQPEYGYGSSENYISTDYTSYTLGQEQDASRIWVFIPNVLKHEYTAPAVILLHGYLSANPFIYQGLINHILKQGIIVLFPQYQESGLSPIISDTDLTVQLQRAIDSVTLALDDISELVEPDNIILFGHSTGALFGLCWTASNGPEVSQMIIAHPCLDFTTWLSEPVTDKMIFPDHITMIPATTVPVVILWGDQDNSYATWPEQVDAYNLLTNVSSKALYVAQSDAHGFPSLVADHVSVINTWEADTQNDSLDFRFYFTVIDAALDSQVNIEFHMGEWSDGIPLNSVLDCSPPENCPNFF